MKISSTILTSGAFLVAGIVLGYGFHTLGASKPVDITDASVTINDVEAVACHELPARLDHDVLLSVDPSLALPMLRLAVESNDGAAVEEAWLRGGCTEARTQALTHLLSLETYDQEYLVRIITRIVDEKDLRIDEVRSVYANIRSKLRRSNDLDRQ